MEELGTLISAYNQKSQSAIQEFDLPENDEQLKVLSAIIHMLVNDLVAIGDEAEKILTHSEEEPTKGLAFMVHYDWIEEAKQVLILWRDTLFQYQKARILLIDKVTTSRDVEDLHTRTIETLKKAVKSQEKAFEVGVSELSGEKLLSSKIEEWNILIDPWPIYKEQIEDIACQASILVVSYFAVEEVAESFERISEEARKVGQHIDLEVDSLKEMAEGAISYIAEYNEEPKKIVFHLETQEQQLNSPANLEQLNLFVDNELIELNKLIQVPIDTAGGLVRYKELNFGKGIRQWLESEIFPSMYEMVDIAERVSNAMKMSLINIRNRAILLSKEVKDPKPNEFALPLDQPIHVLRENIEAWQAEMHSIRETMEGRLSASFRISHIYDQNHEFLPIPLQSTLNQLRIDQNKFWTKTKQWIMQRTTAFQQLRSTVLKEEALSDGEKIVRYVENRSYNHDHHHYDSIFTAEGYIGDSFCVGRLQELEHIVQLIAHWREGYNGAVILHGQRFSGKTLFGDLVSHRYFHQDVIVLRPSNVINIYGRRLITDYNLGDALDFVSKYSRVRKNLVWIDDIELWNDKSISISENINHLMRYLDKGANRMFLMISMNSSSLHHYNGLYGINEAIPTCINLNRMSGEEIRRAILIRHGATHKTLVDDKGQEMKSSEFNRLTSECHRSAFGNIGEALRLWAYASTVTSEQQVSISAMPSYELPDFITDDNAIILRAILLHKITNEYELNKQFGPSFKKKYNILIHRLLGVGVLTRREDGRLQIASAVVNSLTRLLAKHRHISIDKNNS
ncbi:MAG: hypothetical protein ACJA01_000414 [Saprospiraceae bacterium]